MNARIPNTGPHGTWNKGPQRTLYVTLHVGSGLFFEFEIENYDQLLWNARANVKTNTRNPETVYVVHSSMDEIP